MKKRYILPFLLLFQIILINVISHYPVLVERFYSNGFYPFLSRGMRIVLGKIPFSVGDCIYTILILMAIRWLWNNRKNWKQDWKKLSLEILSILSVFYFLFHLSWALNYYRQPLHEKMQIHRDYSYSELYSFTQKLISKTNEIQFQITHNVNKSVKNPYSKEQIFDMSKNGYLQLSKEYSFFKFEEQSTKKSLYSLPFTYMGFGGYMNPFSHEAHLNDNLLMFTFPTVVCHEMAHQIGYAFEDEANFIGFLASKKNPDLYFQYSAYSMALLYCLREIGIQNESQLESLLKTVNPGIIKHFEENNAFWEKYQSPVETVSEFIYDNFLKLNQQKDGMESYNRFVDLLVNYYKMRTL
ncbi:MAG: DUF3810 domain-containing protein [Flavobacterium sp.]